MKVTEVMTPDPGATRPNAALSGAIEVMRERRCGVLPVVDDNRYVVGVLTDRDAALALGDADLRPSELTVDAVMTTSPYTCRAEDPVHRAIFLMQHARVRRLPVVDDDDRLVGVLSIDDIVLAAQNVRAGVGRISFEQAMSTLEAICARSTDNQSRAAYAS